jgi:uncharacterized protein YndB with AHSA1/START domain
MRINENPIVVEEIFDRPKSQVWDAITKVDQMTIWFFNNIPSFEATVGFETQFLVENEGRKFTHLWKVTDVKDQTRIQYDWSYAEYPGKAYVVFELTEFQKQTKLKLSAYGIESFPQHIPEFLRESCEGGWNYFIKQNLKQYLS